MQPVSSLDEEKQLQRRLENWREIFIHLNSLFLWDKPFYPAIIAAAVSAVFLVLWYFEPSVLTTISILGILACIMDFAVPALCNGVFESNQWSGLQQKKFEEICHNLVEIKNRAHSALKHVNDLKYTQPKMYCITAAISLSFLAWICNLFNNVLLSYIIVLMLLLWPGLKHCCIFEQQLAEPFLYIRNFFPKMKQN